jgi:hypothetical protein
MIGFVFRFFAYRLMYKILSVSMVFLPFVMVQYFDINPMDYLTPEFLMKAFGALIGGADVLGQMLKLAG